MTMISIRKCLYKPKKTDDSLFAQFFFADEKLNTVAHKLECYNNRKDVDQCQSLINQLKICQDRVLTVVQQIIADVNPHGCASRDFRVKFPDDIVQENFAGLLWFGAECLAAGSKIMNREAESASMRPLARALTKSLDSLRHMLRAQCYVNGNSYSKKIIERLTIVDKLFAEFELRYVSVMVPVKSAKEYETIQDITVLFSETMLRARKLGYITVEMLDEYDPSVMFTIPRLAIVCGLLIYPDGPLNPIIQSWRMSDMFLPFQSFLQKIKGLLITLSASELLTLEQALCSQNEPDFPSAFCVKRSDQLCTLVSNARTSGLPTGSHLLKGVFSGVAGYCASSAECLGARTLSHPFPNGFADGNGGLTCANSSACEPVRNVISGESVSENGVKSLNITAIANNNDHVDLNGACSSIFDSNCAIFSNACIQNSPVFSDGELSVICSHAVVRNPDVRGDEANSSSNLHTPSIFSHNAEGGDFDSLGSFTDDTPGEWMNGFTARYSRVAVVDNDSGDVNEEKCHTPLVSPLCVPHSDHSTCVVHNEATKTDVCHNYCIPTPHRERSAVLVSSSDILSEQSTHIVSDITEDMMDANELNIPHTALSKEQKYLSIACCMVSTSNIIVRSSPHICAFSKCGVNLSCDVAQDNAAWLDGVSNTMPGSLAKAEICFLASGTADQKCSKSECLSLDKSTQTAFDAEDCLLFPEMFHQDFYRCQQQLHNRCQKNLDHSSLSASEASSFSHRTLLTCGLSGRHVSNTSFQAGNLHHAASCMKVAVTDSQSDQCGEFNTSAGVLYRHQTDTVWLHATSDTSGDCEVDCSSEDDDKYSCGSSDTMSYNSESHGEEEIALVAMGLESASQNQVRARFRNSSDLIHHLFVCISGVADQLQTNFVGDLRSILRVVFNLHCSQPVVSENDRSISRWHQRGQLLFNQFDTEVSHTRQVIDPPFWVPDKHTMVCMSCETSFNFIRRRHHCRNYGKIFCAQCSSNSVPLPQFGHSKPVRVCNHCFVFRVTPFTNQAHL